MHPQTLLRHVCPTHTALQMLFLCLPYQHPIGLKLKPDWVTDQRRESIKFECKKFDCDWMCAVGFSAHVVPAFVQMRLVGDNKLHFHMQNIN